MKFLTFLAPFKLSYLGKTAKKQTEEKFKFLKETLNSFGKKSN